MKKCFQVHPSDNVAVLLEEAAIEAVEIIGCHGKIIDLKAPIGLGHKVALKKIWEGESIIKFGVPVGIATCSVEVGHWVHLHNCRSQLDERSSTLDVHSGATNDMIYE